MDIKERKNESSKIERQILKDLLSILTTKMSVDTGVKLSRTKALSRIMKIHYHRDDNTISQIIDVDRKRELKPRITNADIQHH